MGEGVGGDRLGKLSRLASLGLAFLAVALNLSSCGKPELVKGVRAPELEVAESAVEAAIEGRHQEFLDLVDPHYVEIAARETSMVPGPGLGRLLSMRFVERCLPQGLERVVRAETDFLSGEDRGTALLWGELVLRGGKLLLLSRDEAVRIPLVRRGEHWFVDMLGL